MQGWDKKTKPAGWEPNPLLKEDDLDASDGCKPLDPIPAVSRDGGRTWKQFAPVIAAASDLAGYGEHGEGLFPFGRIAPLPDGTLGVMITRDSAKRIVHMIAAYFYTSGDSGATWQKRGLVVEGHAASEPAWLRLANGDLYTAVRLDLSDNTAPTAIGGLNAYRSTDNGRTWKGEGALTPPGQHPADLTRLPDGRVLLSYGVRNQGDRGISVRVGDAEARIWSYPIRLVDNEGATDEPNLPQPRRDHGYPSTVVLADGTLVTVYYSRGMPSHHRYHVGVVRWKLPLARK